MFIEMRVWITFLVFPAPLSPYARTASCSLLAGPWRENERFESFRLKGGFMNARCGHMLIWIRPASDEKEDLVG